MLDTLNPKYGNNFLMTRFLEPNFKDYSVTDGPAVVFRGLKKAYYGEFYFHCIEHNNGHIKAILSAEIFCGKEYEIHQYVIWELNNQLVATLLRGDEEFNLNEVKR